MKYMHEGDIETAIYETGGPTTLTFGAIPDASVFMRTGTSVVGLVPGVAGQVVRSTGTVWASASPTLTETSGPTVLAIGAVANADALVRTGTDIVGLAPGAAGTIMRSTGAVWAAAVPTLTETGGPTVLTVGAIPAGGILNRTAGVGNRIDGTAGSVQGSVLVWDVTSAAFVDSSRTWALGTTVAAGLTIASTTPAALAAQQYSPALVLSGQGWKTADSSSRTCSWAIVCQPVQGAANPTQNLLFQSSIDGAAFATVGTLTSGLGWSVAAMSASSSFAMGGVAYLRTTGVTTGLGTSYGLDVTAAGNPLVLCHTSRTDGASNVVHATVYDRNAASITNAATMRLHSFGWTNNADAYTELAAIYADGAFGCCYGPNGGKFDIKWLPELTTIAAAAFTDTAIQIPAGAKVLYVPVRVVTIIPTAVTFDVGIAGATTRFGTGIAVAAGTTDVGDDDTAMSIYAAATSVRISPSAPPIAATGQVRVNIYYFIPTAPTS